MLKISSRPDTSIRLDGHEAQMAANRQNLVRQIKRLTDEKEAIDAHFLKRLTENKAVSGQYKGVQVVVLSPWHRTTLDTNRLKVEMPVIWSQYARENSGWRPTYA